MFASVALLFPACADPDDREDGNTTQGGINLPPDPPAEDPGVFLEGIDGEFKLAADEFMVPVEILQAMGYAETQWQMIEGEGSPWAVP